MRYRVTAPLVICKEHGAVRYASLGELVEGLSEADADRLISRGYLAAVGDRPAPAALVDEVEPVVVSSGVVEGRPKKTHGLDKWQAFARAQGLSEADIEGASKADLIAALS